MPRRERKKGGERERERALPFFRSLQSKEDFRSKIYTRKETSWSLISAISTLATQLVSEEGNRRQKCCFIMKLFFI